MAAAKAKDASVQGTEKTRKKRVSKKSKRSWRKHIDIKDIEEHLDEVRRQERLGGVISLKQDEQLYFVESDTAKNEQDTEAKSIQPTKKQKSLRGRTKVFQEPYIKPVLGRKRKIRQHKTKNEDSSDESDGEPVSAPPPQKQTRSSYDLWGSNDQVDPINEQSEIDQYYRKATKKLPVKQPKTAYRVRGKAPAVDVCHPAASYNPTFEDHQSLLKSAFEIEMVKEKDIQKIQRQLQLPTEEELSKLPEILEKEMREGLFDDETNNSDVEDEESGGEEKEQLLPVSKTQPRKTNKEKRKKTERKGKEQTADKLRDEKTKENEVFRMKTFKKEIDEARKKTEERQAKKLAKEKEASLKPKRLGKQKFEEMNIEIQLSDEVSGSLRQLKPEGNLFEDRYKSLQRRNIIEPRKLIAPHRKYALKEYEKRSFKNYDLQEKLKATRKKQ